MAKGKKKTSKPLSARGAHLKLLNQTRSTLWKENKGNYKSYREFLKDKDVTSVYYDLKWLGTEPKEKDIFDAYAERTGQIPGEARIPSDLDGYDVEFWQYEDLPLQLFPSNVYIYAGSISNNEGLQAANQFDPSQLKEYADHCNALKGIEWFDSDDAPRIVFGPVENVEGATVVELYGVNPTTNQRSNYEFKFDSGPPEGEVITSESPEEPKGIPSEPPGIPGPPRPEPEVEKARKDQDLENIRLEGIGKKLEIIDNQISQLVVQVQDMQKLKLKKAADKLEDAIADLVIKKTGLLSQI